MLTSLSKYINKYYFAIKVTSINVENIKNNKKKDNTETVKKVVKPGDIAIRKDQYQVSYLRASGAGGQHVNTTNSKVELRFDIEKYTSDKKVLTKLKSKYNTYLTKDNSLIIRNQESREQQRNLDNAITQLKEILADALTEDIQKEYELAEETPEMKAKRIEKKKRKSNYRNLNLC